MTNPTKIHWIDYACSLPFIALLGTACVADDWQTHTGIGKAIWFYIAMAFIPLVTALSFWHHRKAVKFHTVDFVMLFWLIFTFGFSYVDVYIINNKMVIFLMLGVLYYCFRIFLVQHQNNLRILMIAVMLVGCMEAIWGLSQLYGYARSQHALFGVTGSFFNPGPYAGYLAVILPVSLFYLLWDWQAFAKHRRRHAVFFKVRWAIALVTGVSIVLILPTTMSRAAWLASAVGCAVVLLSYYWRFMRPKQKKRGAIRRMVGWATICALIIGIVGASLYFFKKDSADGRTLIWKVSMEIVSNDWVGKKLGRFAGAYGKAQRDYFNSERATEREAWLAGQPEYAFNDFIQIAVEQGYLSTALFLLSIIVAFVSGIYHRRFMAVGGLAALLVFAMFSYPFSLMPFLVLFVFLLTSCISMPYEFSYYLDFVYGDPIPYSVRRRWNRCVVVAVLLLSTLYIAQAWYKRYPVYKAHQVWGQSQVYYQSGMYERVVDDYEPIARYMRDEPRFIFEYGRSLHQLGRYQESTSALVRGRAVSADPMFTILIGRNQQAAGSLRDAERSYNDAARQVPNRLYPDYLRAKLYDEMEAYKKAYDVAVKIVEKEVKIQSPAVEEMKAEMQQYIEYVKKEDKLSHDKTDEKKAPIQVWIY